MKAFVLIASVLFVLGCGSDKGGSSASSALIDQFLAHPTNQPNALTQIVEESEDCIYDGETKSCSLVPDIRYTLLVKSGKSFEYELDNIKGVSFEQVLTLPHKELYEKSQHRQLYRDKVVSYTAAELQKALNSMQARVRQNGPNSFTLEIDFKLEFDGQPYEGTTFSEMEFQPKQVKSSFYSIVNGKKTDPERSVTTLLTTPIEVLGATNVSVTDIERTETCYEIEDPDKSQKCWDSASTYVNEVDMPTEKLDEFFRKHLPPTPPTVHTRTKKNPFLRFLRL